MCFFGGGWRGVAVFQGMWNALVPRPGSNLCPPVRVLTTRGPGKSSQSVYLKSVILSRKKGGSYWCRLGGGGQDSAKHPRKPRTMPLPTRIMRLQMPVMPWLRILALYFDQCILKGNLQDLPDSPMLKIPSFQCRVLGSIPGQGTKIPHAT